MVQETLSEEIVPAILPESLDDLRQKLGLIAKLVPLVQIDVCDGIFTPEASWPYNDDTGAFQRILSEDDGLPFWDSIDFEIDMMVDHPEEEIEKWVSAGAQRIVLHYTSTTPDILHQLFFDLKSREIETSLAINTHTDISVIDEFVHELDEVQFMGIDTIGFQGEPFVDAVIPRIEAVRTKYPHLNIAVDGGMTANTAEDVLNAGANRIVAGSAIFGNYDVEENLRSLEDLLYLGE